MNFNFTEIIENIEIAFSQNADEFSINIINETYNFEINFSEFGSQGLPGKDGKFPIVQDLPELP